jgi:phenylalanyl-tRNA synthetase beta chain
MPGLLDVILRNRSNGSRDVQIFEMGRTYRLGGSDGLAREDDRLGIAIAGQLGGTSWLGAGPDCDFFSLAAIVDCLLGRLGVSASRERFSDSPLLHPGRAARLVAGAEELGIIGEIHPAHALALEIEGPIALAELDLDALERSLPAQRAHVPTSTFPPVRQDIAIVVGAGVSAAQVLEVVREAGGDLLVGLEVFDVYTDAERLGADRVSLAIRLVFQHHDRTLTEDEATGLREGIVGALGERLGAELRG